MGEKSREVGEQGEKLVGNLLSLMGWAPVEKNLSVLCAHPRRHQRTLDGKRTTHGIDLFFNYKSPLLDFAEMCVCVSIKATSRKYSSSPSTKFKQYLIDISDATECFRLSPHYTKIKRSYPPYIKKHNLHSVIFYISFSDEPSADIKAKVSNITVPTDLKFECIHLVDNNAASFIYDSVIAIRSMSASYKFDYTFSSQNMNDPNISYCGEIFPVEYLSSPQIYMRYTDKTSGEECFCISSAQAFDQSYFERIINLALDMTKCIYNNYTFFFRDYNEANNKNEVEAVIASLRERTRTANIRVAKLSPDFTELLNG